MKWRNIIPLYVLIVAVQISAQNLSAVEILKKSDAVINAPQDQDFKLKLILIDENGDQKERIANMLQKANEKRMIKFLAPADQKGIAFLDLGDDMMYLYLPAFKKVRRIAGHIKNQKFGGTDLTYDDMSTINYHQEFDPQIADETKTYFVLSLKPKEGIVKDYSILKSWIRKDNYYPEKIEYYDHNNNLWKTSERRKIEKVGKYWVAKEMEIHDYKEEHTTKSILEELKFDTGLDDKLFTIRYLKR